MSLPTSNVKIVSWFGFNYIPYCETMSLPTSNVIKVLKVLMEDDQRAILFHDLAGCLIKWVLWIYNFGMTFLVSCILSMCYHVS